MDKFGRIGCSALLSLAATSALSQPAHASDVTEKLLQMSLAELTDIEVTSVSKKSEKASEAAAAIFVITQEDIRRSGATSIPEALRLAPGVQVARAGAHQWAISARGFNDQFANKLLVLIDGRSVYTPMFAGVWWDMQDSMLEDIDRIEVIRGPGATLWGANAVNGVINIITKNSGDTVGDIAAVTGGNEDRMAAFRHGGEFDNGTYRLYGKYSNIDEAETAGGAGAGDEWNMARSGFRSDWKGGDEDGFTLQGDVYSGEEHAVYTLPSLTAPSFTETLSDGQGVNGANVLGRWTRHLSDRSETKLQAYLDHTKRDDVFLEESINTLDLDFQHSWTPGDRHEVVWGAGYRFMYDNLKGTYVTFSPDSRSYDLWSAFAQDKIALLPENGVYLTLGSKFEHNDFSGYEIQPSARLTWLADEGQTLWGSVSRSVRTSMRSSDDMTLSAAVVPLPTGGVGVISAVGERGKEAEDALSYELGYRVQPVEAVSLDWALFYNDYANLFTETVGTPFLGSTPPFGPHVIIPLNPVNAGSGESYGFELAANWQASDYWALSASYSLLELTVNGTSAFVTAEGKSPNQQFNVRSHYAFGDGWEMDNLLYYTDSLAPGTGISVPDYLRFDTRLGWTPMDGVELSLVGQNLLDDSHPEFSGFIYQSMSEIGRSVYGKVTLRF